MQLFPAHSRCQMPRWTPQHSQRLRQKAYDVEARREGEDAQWQRWKRAGCGQQTLDEWISNQYEKSGVEGSLGKACANDSPTKVLKRSQRPHTRRRGIGARAYGNGGRQPDRYKLYQQQMHHILKMQALVTSCIHHRRRAQAAIITPHRAGKHQCHKLPQRRGARTALLNTKKR